MFGTTLSGAEVSTLVHVIVAFFIAGTLLFQWRAIHPAVSAAADSEKLREAIPKPQVSPITCCLVSSFCWR